MHSRASGAAFSIFISKPIPPLPETGYPTIYMLDANAAFATMVEALTLQSLHPAVTGVGPAVVIGIGYPTDFPLDLVRRTYDYTPVVPAAALGSRPDGTPWPPTGGADVFLDFIEQELKPAIAGDIRIDAARQSLFGHSFGGLFVLHTLFTRPATFSTYVAGSPSIWFGDRAILETEQKLAGHLRALPQTLRLMVGVGGLEQTVSERECAAPQLSPRAAWITRNRMVDNARDMAARLRELGPHGLELSYEEFAGENHVSVIPALVSRALRFMLAPANP